jgi:catechol 2,3-dioxygenase-like lactoylglutathione lyase family enzyme
MFQKVAFTMYPVKDMPRARAFYEETLELGPGSGGASSPWVEFDLPGGGCLAITTVTQNEASANAGGTIAFEVDDLPAAVAELKAKGVTFKAEEIDSPVCRMAFIEDPDGNGIILHKLKTAEERARQ